MAVIKENATLDKVLGNIDLLTKILNFLPPKPLVRFQAVSNHWLNLISDPLFLLNHSRHRRTTHPPSRLSQFYYNKIPISLYKSDEIIPKIDRLEGVRLNAPNTNYLVILNSCNGLVLCKYHLYSSFIVFNPTTNKHRSLPELFCDYYQVTDTVLAFDPLKSFDYKVVSFRSLPFDQTYISEYDYYDRGRVECVIDIFSSKTDSWKQISLPVPLVGLSISRRVFWNGGIHWISNKNFHVRFDVNEENFTWNEIPTDPNIFPEGDNIEYMGECDSGLLLIKFPQNRNFLKFGEECTFTVLEMKKDSDSWVPKHHVNLKTLAPPMGMLGKHHVNLKYNVLHVLSESAKDCFSLVLGIHGKIILYSVNNRKNHITRKVLKDLRCHVCNHNNFFPFIPCLAPV